jgi:hypothetical protein
METTVIHRVLCKICGEDIALLPSDIIQGKAQCPVCMNEISIDEQQ